MQEDVKDTSPVRTTAVIEGLLTTAYTDQVLDQEDRAEGLKQLARKVYAYYESQIPETRKSAMSLGPFVDINRKVIDGLLDPETGLLPEYRAILRTRLNIPGPMASTNTGPQTVPAVVPGSGAR